MTRRKRHPDPVMVLALLVGSWAVVWSAGVLLIRWAG